MIRITSYNVCYTKLLRSTIYKSVDRGESFSAISNVPGASEIKCIIVHNSVPGTFLVAIESFPDKIYKTTDDGQSWILSLDNATFSFFGIPVEQDPSNPETIYTMSDTSFMRSVITSYSIHYTKLYESF